ncbi:MAG: hypothetical protein ABIB71_07385 [Candidatus Woesearchaeota archaeon]
MNGRKGSSSSAASDVSILIILIALFILAYVIMLPPEERSALINETYSDDSEDSASTSSAKVLFSASPGKVFSYSTNVQTINLEPVHVFSRESSSTTSLVKSLYVNRNFIQNGYKEIYFDIEDVDNLNSLKLLMLVAESKGPIAIKFNGRLVYQGYLASANLPISLPQSAVKEEGNKLEFSIPMPWWKLTSSFYYSLQDIGLIEEMKEEKSSSSRSFMVDAGLAEQVTSAELRYYLGCNTVDEQSTLTVLFNGRNLYSDTIFCQYTDERIVPLPRAQFKGRERHTLSFKVDSGDYNIDEPKIKVKLARSAYPTNVFEVDSDLWGKISDGDAKVKLYFKFSDDGSRKRARVLVQDKEFAFDTTLGTYSREITSSLDDGANVIKLIPQSNFEINNMKVYWE